MNGTRMPATLPMRLMPPMITAPTTAATVTPEIHPGTPKYSLVTSAMFQAWDMLPPVDADMSRQMQKMTAMTLPTHAYFGLMRASALSATHIGPPWGLSGSSVFRA